MVLDAGKRGRGLAARRAFAPGEEIARDMCAAWVSVRSGTIDAPTPTVSRAGPPDAMKEFAGLGQTEPQALIVASLLLRRWEARVAADGRRAASNLACRGGCLQELNAGPRHWLKLPGPRQSLEERCRVVQRLLAEGRRQGRFSAAPSDQEVMDEDLRRLGSSVGQSAACIAVPVAFRLLNHSCNPNAQLRWHGPVAILLCLRHIAVGEEICVSYINELDGVLGRRYFLLEQQGFRCLCPRCQANFSGIGDNTINGWRCDHCSTALREEAIRCTSCGRVVTLAIRTNREKRCHDALQLASQAMQLARSQGPKAAADMLRRVVNELLEVLPAGAAWLVKATGMLNACCVQACISKDAEAAAEELARQRAVQREAIANEAATVLSLARLPSEEPWARRLIDALRMYEPTEVAMKCGWKRHIGPPTDGGYVVWDSGRPLCDTLLSYGVDTNVDFEVAIADAGARVFLFDHTVPGTPRRHPNFVFCREALADEDIDGVAGTLEKHIRGLCGRVMLKVDVEGEEFSAVLCTPHDVLGRFEQICMELHWLGRPSRGGDFRTKALALERLREQFVLLHAHGNSYGDVINVAGCELPDVLEVLLVNRNILAPHCFRPSRRGIPDPSFDVNNCTFIDDVELSGPPFGADLG